MEREEDTPLPFWLQETSHSAAALTVSPTTITALQTSSLEVAPMSSGTITVLAQDTKPETKLNDIVQELATATGGLPKQARL